MENQYKVIIQFIRKLYSQPEGFIPLHAPVFGGNEKKYLEECIDTTFVSSVGKFVDEFELKMAVPNAERRTPNAKPFPPPGREGAKKSQQHS